MVVNTMDANELKELTDLLDARYVQKDACSAHHEKTDEKINTLIVENTQTKVKLSIIQWVGVTACGASIATFVTMIISALKSVAATM
jgi:ABC-type nickel/cobalt efflux system permease component RcnA